MQYTGPSHDIGEMRFIQPRLDGGVLTIMLNRPEQQNTMNVEMTLEMETLLKAVHADTEVRVIVLRGAGEGFSVGMDVDDFSDTTRYTEIELRAARESAYDWRVRLLRLLPQPVIALVHGYCKGDAVAIIEACDIVMVAHDACFELSEATSTGVLVGGSSSKAISQVMLPRAANYYALTGESFDGREAELNGLATRGLPPSDLDAETYSLARDLAAKEPLALRFTKETLLHAPSMTWDGVLNFTAAKFAELKMLQMGQPSVRANAVDSFLSGKSKPGLGG